jgi:hypothetical protein
MTEFDSHAYKKPRRDGYEKVDADKVCLYCGVTEKDEKKFYRVDRMKKMKYSLVYTKINRNFCIRFFDIFTVATEGCCWTNFILARHEANGYVKHTINSINN